MHRLIYVFITFHPPPHQKRFPVKGLCTTVSDALTNKLLLLLLLLQLTHLHRFTLAALLYNNSNPINPTILKMLMMALYKVPSVSRLIWESVNYGIQWLLTLIQSATESFAEYGHLIDVLCLKLISWISIDQYEQSTSVYL